MDIARAQISATNPKLDGEALVANDTRASLTLEDDRDIALFQEGDEVQPGITVRETDPANNTMLINGGVWGAPVNNSQVWSDSVTGTAFNETKYSITNAFDGDLSTRSMAAIDTNLYFEPATPIPVNSSLRIYVKVDNAAVNGVISVNNVDYSNLITEVGTYWITIPNVSSLTQIMYGISINNGEELCSVGAIEVDGKYLVDSATAAQPLGPNMSEKWSEAGTNSGWVVGNPFVNLFDGLEDSFDHGAAGVPGIWTHTINNVSSFKMRVWVPNIGNHVRVNDLKVNGNDVVQEHVLDPGLSQDTWHTIDLGDIGTFESLYVDDTYWVISSITINGQMLVDGPSDNSQLWSDGIVAADNDRTKAFNGVLSNYAVVGGSGAELVWNGAVIAQSKVEVYFHELGGSSQYDNSVSANGGAYSATAGEKTWVEPPGCLIQ